MPVECKHLWVIVKSTGGKNNGHNLLRFSMVVDGIKESRTRMGSTDTLLLFLKGSVWGWSETADLKKLKMVECNNHKWTHTIASWTCCLFVCMCSCIYYKLQYVLLYIHTSISLNNKIINESKISCINYKEIYKRNWIGIDIFWIGIEIDKFDVELELTKWNWVELELELTKWNWPHVWKEPLYHKAHQFNLYLYTHIVKLTSLTCTCTHIL